MTSSSYLFTLFHRSLQLMARQTMHGGYPHHGGRAQMQLLSILDRQGPMAQRELTELSRIRPASLSELLNKLENRGYIERERNPEDRRAMSISITEIGQDHLEQWVEPFSREMEQLFSPLTEQECRQLSHLLEKLVDNWERETSPRRRRRS